MLNWWLPENVSTFGRDIDWLFHLIYWITGITFILVAVMPNPYFGVTDATGTTKIENVPPGKYKVDVWHETLGKQTKEVEVKAGRTAKVAFELKK